MEFCSRRSHNLRTQDLHRIESRRAQEFLQNGQKDGRLCAPRPPLTPPALLPRASSFRRFCVTAAPTRTPPGCFLGNTCQGSLSEATWITSQSGGIQNDPSSPRGHRSAAARALSLNHPARKPRVTWQASTGTMSRANRMHPKCETYAECEDSMPGNKQKRCTIFHWSF